MTNIGLHLTANFYPPIPADIQFRVQEIFDELQRDSMPCIIGWADMPEDWEYEFADETVFDREYWLPNDAIVTGRSMCDELRLWDAFFWDCEEPNESYEDYMKQEDERFRQVPGQMNLFDYSESKWVSHEGAVL